MTWRRLRSIGLALVTTALCLVFLVSLEGWTLFTREHKPVALFIFIAVQVPLAAVRANEDGGQ
jgi:hypothetical protein